MAGDCHEGRDRRWESYQEEDRREKGDRRGSQEGDRVTGEGGRGIGGRGVRRGGGCVEGTTRGRES
eukprot:768357-Hanusia_phi.AAC.5